MRKLMYPNVYRFPLPSNIVLVGQNVFMNSQFQPPPPNQKKKEKLQSSQKRKARRCKMQEWIEVDKVMMFVQSRVNFPSREYPSWVLYTSGSPSSWYICALRYLDTRAKIQIEKEGTKIRWWLVHGYQEL